MAGRAAWLHDWADEHLNSCKKEIQTLKKADAVSRTCIAILTAKTDSERPRLQEELQNEK